MEMHRNPLFWSFGLGTWMGVRLRVSFFFPLLLCWRWYQYGSALGSVFGGLSIATAICGLLFISVLLHECGHILAARATGGRLGGDEILIWPMGGLARVDPRSTPRALMLTAAAGPAVNLVLCLLTLPAVFMSGHFPGALNPFSSPIPLTEFWNFPLYNLQVVLFHLSWIMLLINLIPAYPLDGGQILRGWLTGRFGESLAGEIAIQVAYVTAVVLVLVGVIENQALLVVLALVIVVLALLESHQARSGEQTEESFLGYDFSQGYTSLERSQPKAGKQQPAPRPGLLQRWQERRRAEKVRRQAEAQQQAEQQLDALLAKVHEQGIGALSESEKRMLKQASERFRTRGDGQ